MGFKVRSEDHFQVSMQIHTFNKFESMGTTFIQPSNHPTLLILLRLIGCWVNPDLHESKSPGFIKANYTTRVSSISFLSGFSGIRFGLPIKDLKQQE